MPAMGGERSQIVQALHYFARPHDGIRRTPVGGAASWRADALRDEEWVVDLSDGARFGFDPIESLAEALRGVESLGRPTRELRREDFRWPRLRPLIEDWRRRIVGGRGFVLLRGLPVEGWSAAQIERVYWGLGLHLGFPGAQNPAGDLLGHVRDTGAPADGSVRQYRTNEFIDYHCDLADAVGLLCLRPASRGGASRIASSVYAYDELLRRRPDLVERLYEPFRLDTKDEGGVPFIPIEPVRHWRGALRTFWHGGYFRSVARHGSDFAPDPRQSEVLALYDEILAEPGVALEMELQAGDLQLLSNHAIVHGRAAFSDGETRGVGEGRHLLRLWLSFAHHDGFAERCSREVNRARVVARLARLRLFGA